MSQTGATGKMAAGQTDAEKSGEAVSYGRQYKTHAKDCAVLYVPQELCTFDTY